MELNELIKEAGAIAEENGFHESKQIIDKLIRFQELNQNEILAVIRAFEAQKIMLIVTELSEFIEAHRKDNIENMREEIADTFIRLFDFTAVHMTGIEDEIREKMNINKRRPKKHGKLY